MSRWMIPIVVFFFTTFAQAVVDEDELILVEAIIGGAAKVRRVGEESFIPLKTKDMLAEGDTVLATEGAGIDLRLSDGSMLRLASESSLKLEEITKDENGWTSWVMDLLDGFVRGQVRSNEQGSTAKMKLKISSPLAQMGVRGTEFTFGIEGETSILETHSGEVLLGSKTTSLEKNEGIERVRSGQISSLSRGQARPKPAVASASGRRQHQNMNQFFQRSRELAERPILLKARFQDLRDVERKQLRENFQRARPNFVPSVRKPEVLLNRPAMPQGNSQLRPRQTTLPMPPVAQGRATRSPAPMPTANRAGVMRPAMPANSGAAMPAPMPANGRGTRPQR